MDACGPSPLSGLAQGSALVAELFPDKQKLEARSSPHKTQCLRSPCRVPRGLLHPWAVVGALHRPPAASVPVLLGEGGGRLVPFCASSSAACTEASEVAARAPLQLSCHSEFIVLASLSNLLSFGDWFHWHRSSSCSARHPGRSPAVTLGGGPEQASGQLGGRAVAGASLRCRPAGGSASAAEEVAHLVGEPLCAHSPLPRLDS